MAIPDGIGKLLSPFSTKLSSGLIKQVSDLISNGVDRVICIVNKKEIDIPIIRSLLVVPAGKDFVTHALSIGKTMIVNKVGIDVEFYLMEDNSLGNPEFYRLD
jgi:hypothetical protein